MTNARMGRGVWHIALAAAAFSLEAANPPHGHNQRTANTNADQAPARVAVTNFPFPVDQGCDKGEEKRHSDLCAQWKAADSTRDAARYALGALIISAIGTMFLYLTLRSQRQTSRAELRAYLFPDSTLIFDGSHHQTPKEKEMVPGVILTLKNFGSTPAHKVKHWGVVILAPSAESFIPPEPDMSICALSTFAPSATQVYLRPLVANPLDNPESIMGLTDTALEEVRRGSLQLMLYGRIIYSDVFGKTRTTNYRMFWSGKWPPREGAILRFSHAGNEST